MLRGLASPARVRILRLLHREEGANVNEIAAALDLPQSTVSSNLQMLEAAGLIRTETRKGRKGNQKLCFSAFDEVVVMIPRRSGQGAGRRDRSRNADRALHELRGQRALRALLAARDHRPARRSGNLPQSRPDECGADVVHARLRRVPVSQQRAPRRQVGGRARILARNVVRGAGNVGRVAVGHHGRGQRPGDRNVDQPRRFRRQARRLHARTGGSSRAASTASSRAGGSPRKAPLSTA